MTTTIAVPGEIQDRQAWLEWRRGGIGASDAAAVAGLDPYRGPLAIWLDKTGRTPLEREEKEHARWGRLLEDAIIHEFEIRTGLFVPVRQRMVEHPERSWMRATVDGIVCDARDSLPIGILEVKTVAGFKSEAWADGAVPEHFQIQVLHQLGVTGHQHAWIAVLFGGQRLEIREVERNEEDLAALLDLEEAFWARVLSGSPPSGDGSIGSTDALRLAYGGGGEAMTLPLEAGEVLLEREQAKLEEKAAATRAAAAEQTLMAWLGDAEVGLYDGQRRVTWKSSKRSSVDVDALRKEHLEWAQEFTRSTPYRTLRFIGSKADSGGES